MTCCAHPKLLDTAASRAREAGVFSEVRVDEQGLVCVAQGSAEPAEYRLFWEGEQLWVSLVTPNRWLSESIEAELMHTGDKIEELIEDELVDLGYEGETLRVEHFRSEDLLFTFRSPIDLSGLDTERAAARSAVCLLGYEACFRQLGDMSESDED